MIQRKPTGQYMKGVSGNPKGRSKGARTKSAMMAEELFRGELKPIIRAVIDAALEGDMAAARIIVERLCPLRKGAPVRIEGMPTLDTLSDVHAATGMIVALMAEGELSPEEAMSASAVVEMQRRAIETMDLEKRIARLESSS